MKINATVKTYNVYFLAPTENGLYEIIAKVTDGEYTTVNTTFLDGSPVSSSVVSKL